MLKVGCQTYTWEMLGDAWTGKVDDILDLVAAAGYEGIEITNSMIREYAGRPADFAKAIAERGLKLAGFAYASPAGLTDPAARAKELEGADEAMRFVATFPGVVLALGGASTPERTDVDRKIGLAADFYNEVGKRGKKAGVPVAFHPHSHHGSIFESRAEYLRIMALTDPETVGWNPDTGHIVRGGQDLLDTLRTFGARIIHVHLKDADPGNNWQPLGKGVCDIPAVLKYLEDDLGYRGWVVGEEESAEAHKDQNAAIRWNRTYLKSLGH
jgi:sugar phosphate isomerase/epimerase